MSLDREKNVKWKLSNYYIFQYNITAIMSVHIDIWQFNINHIINKKYFLNIYILRLKLTLCEVYTFFLCKKCFVNFIKKSFLNTDLILFNHYVHVTSNVITVILWRKKFKIIKIYKWKVKFAEKKVIKCHCHILKKLFKGQDLYTVAYIFVIRFFIKNKTCIKKF